MKRLAITLLAAAGILVGIVALWPAAAGASILTTQPPLVCGLSQRANQEADSTYVLSRANAFNTGGPLCIRPAPGGKPGFTIMNNLPYDGQYQAYPFTGTGCAYSLCSRNTGLPERVSRLPYGANTSFTWRQNHAAGDWNASWDIWLGKTSQITTEDNGAELMIWLRPNISCDSNCQRVRIGHRTYLFQWWRSCDKAGICWNYLQFRTLRVTGGLKDLWLAPFLRFLEARGLVRPSWWLTSIHAGFELVSGGRGLQITWFNAHT